MQLPLMDIVSKFVGRFPKVKEVIPVFAVVAFPIYAWTTSIWLWKLPSWLLFLTPLEIAAVFSYAMMAVLVECILAFSLILLIALILPPRLFQDAFLVRGSWMAIGLNLCFLGNGARKLTGAISGFKLASIPLATWSWIGIFVVLLLVFLSTRFRFMASFAAWLSERLVIFLYLQIPVSILSIIVVIVRNTF
jgi:hypothetical protein